jgi:hypothetical protein
MLVSFFFQNQPGSDISNSKPQMCCWMDKPVCAVVLLSGAVEVEGETCV